MAQRRCEALRRNRRELLPNPFVALADISIALAFLLALAAIAMSKDLSDMTRDERQQNTRNDLVSLLAGTSAIELKEDEENGFTGIVRVVPSGGRETAGRIWTNGSYQRIAIPGMFNFGGSRLKEGVQPALRGVATYLRDHKDRFAYLYFHGIAEDREAEEYTRRVGRRIDRDGLSTLRAQRVFEFFANEGMIAPAPNLDGDPRLDPQFVVPYGKSGLYDLSSKAPLDKDAVGRVDLILFYADTENDRK